MGVRRCVWRLDTPVPPSYCPHVFHRVLSRPVAGYEVPPMGAPKERSAKLDELDRRIRAAREAQAPKPGKAGVKGWIVVMEHPYYAVSDGSGAFTLTDVPAGEYEVKFWHETLGEAMQNVTVEAGGEASVSVEMSQS